MKSIKLGDKAVKNVDYYISVPVQIVPPVMGMSQCSITRYQQTDKDLGLLLTEEEYNNIPEEVGLTEKIAEGVIAEPVEIFSPEHYFQQPEQQIMQDLISLHEGDTADSVTANISFVEELTVDHEGDSAAVIKVSYDSSNPEVISSEGVVVRPAYDTEVEKLDSDGEGITVVITATIDMSKAVVNGEPESYDAVKAWKASKAFVFKVLKAENPQA